MASQKMLKTLTLCAALFGAAACSHNPVQTSATAAVSQPAGFYHMKLGENLTVTALYDGASNLKPSLLHNISDAQRDRMLNAMFVPQNQDGVQTSINAYLVRHNGQLSLIDAGMGETPNTALGHILANLKAAGVQPEEIDNVIVTHLHPDHAGGMTANGKRVFPNATLYVPQEEADFFLAPPKADAPENLVRALKTAAAAVAPYQQAGKLKTFKKGESIQGIDTLDEFGHTPGMSGYLVGTGKNRMLIWGDVVHSHAIQFQRPEVTIEFDHDHAAAQATRKRILATAKQDKLWIAGAHLPFPGIGHVVADGKAYRWLPVEYVPFEAQ